MKNEIWKDIVIEKQGVIYDFTGKYQVSNLGRVRSLNYGGTGEIKVLQLKKNHDYLHIGLYKNGKQEWFGVHRLVATAFIPNDDPEHKTHVNHIDEFAKTDNRVENLSWTTPKENMNHGTRTQRGVMSRSKRYCNKIVCVETGEVFESGMDIERKTGLDQAGISKCCNGKQKTCGKCHWMYVTDLFIEIHNRVMEKVEGIKAVQLDMLMD